MPAINRPADGSCGYVAFYETKSVEVYADSIYGALKLARRYFSPPASKLYRVHVMLAEVNGTPVVHAADF